VGVGYSYVENPGLLAKTDLQAAMDVTELIKALAQELPTLQTSPLYIVGESYGGKHAAMIGVSVARFIHAGSLNLTLGGIENAQPNNKLYLRSCYNSMNLTYFVARPAE
jgi:serine carboxypeptidase 1